MHDKIRTMPRHDTDHEAVKAALVKAGWIITHDPLTLEYGRRNLFVDLGAESEAPIGAEKEGRKIAVEVKSFRGTSDMPDWERGLGQYLFYGFLLGQQEPGRQLYLALREAAYERIVDDVRGVEFLQTANVRLILIDSVEEVITRWIPPI